MPEIYKDSPEFVVRNTVRRLKKSKRSKVHEYSGISAWSTVSTSLKKLSDDKVIMVDDTGNDEVYINPEYAYYVGISVGTCHVKVSFLDYDFQTVFLNKIDQDIIERFTDKNKFVLNEHNLDCAEFCKVTPDNSEELNSLLSEVCELIIEVKEKNLKNLNAICFAFPGWIDYKNQKILKSQNISILKSLTLDRILNSSTLEKLEGANIKYHIEHNAKTAIVAEKEIGGFWSPFFEDTNVACLYMGKGIGISFILHNQLYRGDNNLAGQFGHTSVPFYKESDVDKEKKCSCGKIDCLENLIRNDVFKGLDLKKVSTDELVDYIKNDNEAPDKLVHYLTTSLCGILNVMSVNSIVVTGKLSKIFPVIETKFKASLNRNESEFSEITIRNSRLEEFSSARGAAICAYFRENNAPIKWPFSPLI